MWLLFYDKLQGKHEHNVTLQQYIPIWLTKNVYNDRSDNVYITMQI